MTQQQTKSVAFTPRPFGRYYLIDKMAVGGMAEVFNAVLFGIHGFEMPLVIKRILPNLSANQRFVDMFVVEAKIYVALQHQNIVQIYDFHKFHEQYFIALEFVEGRDLKSVLNRCLAKQRQLPTPVALFIAHQICHGLEYAHTRTDDESDNLGLVHRDLSPANILLSYTGEVKIADFGIAKAKMHAEITDSGVLKGKYRYMSPEQAHGKDIDHRSDIFAVGILLYEMLTGTKLFDSEDDHALLEQVKRAHFIEPRKHNAAISPRLNKIICRALHKSPHGRFQSAKDLQEALAEEMNPHTVSSLSRDLTHVMGQLFAEDKKRDRTRRKDNRNIAWNEHTMPAEDLDLELEDIDIVESTPVPFATESNEHLQENVQEQLHSELERIRQYNRLLMISTLVLVLYVGFSLLG
jgi:eukaryotic-like serine/threonine-protein kinase